MKSLRFPLRDRDGKYGQAFDTVFHADDLRLIKSAPQAPQVNAHCERVIGIIRREALDHILITGESRARRVPRPTKTTTTDTDPTKPETNYHPRLNTGLPQSTTSTPTDCTAPASSAESSMSTGMLLDQQR